MTPDLLNKEMLYMRRALDLAVRGRGAVSPNPMVGCVIVKNDLIIGEGFHERYGGPHAEVNAIGSVADKNVLTGSTLYVSLEPCAHHGKTPPCADLIVQYPFHKVVVCNHDPNPMVAGKGIKKIKEAGIQVAEAVLEQEGRLLNKRFFTFMEKRRPFIILKWAETEDGFIAREDSTSKWISNEWSRKWVHKWRTEEDAILVGTNTALCDNPKLNVRDWAGRDPLRIFIDKDLKVLPDAFLLDRSQQTICYNTVKDEVLQNLEYVKTRNEKESVVRFILEDLYKRKVQSLIVEGGAKLLNSFIHEGLWDEIRLFRSPVRFGKGISAPRFTGALSGSEKIAGDELLIYKNPHL